MKFVYHYKTSDGERHDGIYCAASKTAVYDELKAKGVKPFGVELAPGFWNRIESLGKRGLAIVVLSLVALALILMVVRDRSSGSEIGVAVPRHQIYGDPARIAEFEREGFTQVFSHPGERYLAYYAQPGVTPDFEKLRKMSVADIPASLTNEVVILDADSREAREFKQIVLWMKDELREYLSDGVGTPASYVRRLNQRLNEELMILNRAKNEIATEGEGKLAQVNERLRNLGLKTIVSTEESGEAKR